MAVRPGSNRAFRSEPRPAFTIGPRRQPILVYVADAPVAYRCIGDGVLLPDVPGDAGVGRCVIRAYNFPAVKCIVETTWKTNFKRKPFSCPGVAATTVAWISPTKRRPHDDGSDS